MLNIIKIKKIVELMDGKIKRNKPIFITIEEELVKEGVFKSVQQIRSKFKSLKAEYLKTKRHNNISGNHRQDCDHYELLDEILGHRPLALISGEDTQESEKEDLVEEVIPELAYFDNIIQEDPIAETPTQQSAVVSLGTLQATPTFSPVGNAKKTPSLRGFKSSQKHSYQSTISTFTEEWKTIQDGVFKKLKEQEVDLVTEMKNNDKNNLEQLELLLQKDREETMKSLKDVLNSFSSQM